MQHYLLDTNAYFKILCFLCGKIDPISDEYLKEIKEIFSGKIYISQITLIEIVSVVGKYARGSDAQISKCNCVISETGDVCQNQRYSLARKKWKNKEVRAWLKLIDDIVLGRSSLITIEVIHLTGEVITEAEKFIEHSLRYSFASMDAMITATAINEKNKGRNLTVITSDKSLKAGMAIANIPYCDAFKDVRYKA